MRPAISLQNFKESNMEINIGISDKQREKIAKGLSKVLADTYTLLPQNPQLSLKRHRPAIQRPAQHV